MQQLLYTGKDSATKKTAHRLGFVESTIDASTETFLSIIRAQLLLGRGLLSQPETLLGSSEPDSHANVFVVHQRPTNKIPNTQRAILVPASKLQQPQPQPQGPPSLNPPPEIHSPITSLTVPYLVPPRRAQAMKTLKGANQSSQIKHVVCVSPGLFTYLAYFVILFKAITA